STDIVEDAFFAYLKKLEALARLQIVAMYCEEKTDPELNTLHVIGRTYGEPRQHFYRRYFRRAWTPWEPVGAEIEGDHLVAVVWRDRLRLFCAASVERSDPTANDSQSPSDMGDTELKDLMPNHVIDVQLNWSQYYQGEWTTREAGGFAKPIEVTVPDDFDKQSVFIHASKEYDVNGI